VGLPKVGFAGLVTPSPNVVDGPAGGRGIQRESKTRISRLKLLPAIGEKAIRDAIDCVGAQQANGMQIVISRREMPAVSHPKARLVLLRRTSKLGTSASGRAMGLDAIGPLIRRDT
jgi:hypothetical protein